VFKYGTVFSGRVFDSERPEEVHQTVTPGDADPLVDANGLRVDLRGLSQKTIQAMRLSSPVITPNADGINDEIEIVYDLLNLTRTEPATVEVYDLAGRRLGSIRAGVAESGRFSTVWNGRDDLGNVLPPGLYIIRLMVETDNGTVAKQRTVSLAY